MEVQLIWFCCFVAFVSSSVIIPEELPSLLSVAYSNIPPIKKGTDSRVGFGFAFGNHADFQVMFELGPQTNTNPIGQTFPANTKRHAPNQNEQKLNKNKEKFLSSDAGSYLKNWAEKMRNPQQQYTEDNETELKPGEVPNLEDSMVELVKNEKGEYEIHQPSPSHMPTNVLDSLKRLYGQKKAEAIKKVEANKTEKKRSREEIKKITDDLSNVDLD